MDYKININFTKRQILLFILIHLLFILSCSNNKSPKNIALDYKNAFNTHIVDSLLGFYSDDIVFNIPDQRMHLTGKEVMRGLAEYDSVLNTIMELSDIKVSNDTVYCSIREINDWMNITGISSAYYPQSIFVVRDSKIIYIEANMADSSLKNWSNALNIFFPWVKETHPDALEELMPEGKFQLNAKSGSIFIELLKKWKDTKI